MKAVVLAGGFGTRIQPLTSSMPKPMLPLMNRPMLEHIVDRLEGVGADDITMLLYFMPEKIREHFEARRAGRAGLRFIVPDADYGTAGSVAFAAQNVSETFIVMSGDLVTDIDLAEVVRFHRSRGAVATITLTSVSNPLQFGVVIADGKGRVQSFLEKPGWGEVVSDTVNTGIYVLEPEVFGLIPAGRSFDFSKDLFPVLLGRKMPLYGFVAKGYWRDVGNPDSYRDVYRDIFTGKTSVPIPGERVEAGGGVAWLDEGAALSPQARIRGTVVLGRGVRLPRGHYSDAVFGEGCEVHPDSDIRSSVLWSRVSVGKRCKVNRAVLCDGVRVGDGVRIPEGAMIASDCILEDGVSVERDVLLWPGKRVEAGSVLSTNLIWGDRWKAGLFEANSVAGQTNVQMSSGFAAKLGEAFGSVLDPQSRILVSRDSHRASRMLKRAFLGGILSTGISVYDLRFKALPVTRYKLTTFGEVAAVHFRQRPGDDSSTEALFYDADGFALGEDRAKEIERIFFREKFRRSHHDEVGTIFEMPYAVEFYREGFRRTVDAAGVRAGSFSVVFDLGNGATTEVLPGLMADLGIEAVVLNAHSDDSLPSSSAGLREGALRRVAKIVRALGADMGFCLSPSGERLFMVDDLGRVIPDDRALLMALSLVARTSRKKARVFLPVQAPLTAASRITNLKVDSGRISRLGREAYERYDLVADLGGLFAFTRLQPHWDGVYAVASILEMLASLQVRASEVCDALPDTTFLSGTVVCPAEVKGKVMRNFREAMAGTPLTYADGIKASVPEGWILLLPDVYGSRVSLFVESADRRAATRLHSAWTRRITRWVLGR